MAVGEKGVTENPDLRQQILDAARQLFVKEGYHKVSMRRIAREIGYSPTSIYLHFRSKGELFDCLVDEMLEKMLKRLENIRQEGFGPVDTLKRILHAYVELGVEDPNRYRLGFMVETDLRGGPDDHLPPDSLSLRLYREFSHNVRECLNEPNPPQNLVDLAVQAVWAAVHGLTALMITYPAFGWVGRDALATQVINSAVDGIID